MNFNKLRNILTVYLFIIGISFSFAQNRSIEIDGKVVNSFSKTPIEFATVSIFDKVSKKAISGTITNAKGEFKIIVASINFYVEVSFIGFTTKTITAINTSNSKLHLGEIQLVEDNHQLNEIVINSEKSQTEFKLDKRVFNVSADLSNSGASALEVLNSVPSVNVNIEGEISLRGNNGVQILIDGKPSVLARADGNALGSITADMIEKVEVITNPSAKYDAEGTSGIINIVIKKAEKRGLNGAISLNIGSPNSNSFGLSLNKRTEKFNLFSQLGFGLRTYPDDSESINSDFINNTTITSTGKSTFDEKFGNVLIGTDYHINKNNVITLSGSVAYEIEDQESNTDFIKTTSSNTITDSWLRNEITEANNPKLRYELQYKKSFNRHEDQNLLFSALGSTFGKDQSSKFINTYNISNEADALQETSTDYKLKDYTFKLDYTHPFLDKYSFETGAQYVLNNVSNDFAVSDFTNNSWVDNLDLTNVFDYHQNVLGLYGTTSFENDVWGVKAGIRMETTDLNTELKTTNEKNSDSFTNLFPSLHGSYKITDNSSVQMGFSKRINRPGLRDLNPFSNIRNNYSISTGNPDLQPEYTDSYELTVIHILSKGSLNFSIYRLNTKDVVERISNYNNSVSISKPENVGTKNTTGFEFNFKYTPIKWFGLNGDFNYNYFKRNGIYESQSFDFNGDRYSASLTSKFKFPKDYELEISGDYRSKYKSLQRLDADMLYVDMGLRKKIFKGKTILNLSVRDVFASMISKSETSDPEFYIFNSRQRGRFITFGISYGFGKGEAMQFSGQRR